MIDWLKNLALTENVQKAAAEFLGTMAFVFFGVGAVGATSISGVAQGSALVWIAIAHGIGIFIAIAAFGRISGAHLNPAVTVAALVAGKIGMVGAIRYIAAQLLGSIAAVGLLKLSAFGSVDNLGVHMVQNISLGQAFLLEVILTFILVMTVFAVAMDRRSVPQIVPAAIGLVVLAEHFVGVPVTGASMNPARSLGPALIAGNWSDHWLYWVAPLLGGILAAAVYTVTFAEKSDKSKFGKISL